MANNTTKDMTSGSTMKLILGFAVPLLMGMLFQQVYSLVDTIIVGRFLGVSALAAVGATGSMADCANMSVTLLYLLSSSVARSHSSPSSPAARSLS